MPGHGRGGRRERVPSIAGWLIGFAAAGGLAVGEADRIAAARATVPGGWGAGIAVGAGAGFALAALCAVTMLVRHRRPWVSDRLQAILFLAIFLLWVVAFLASTPPRQVVPHSVPHVITSAVEVAEIAYVGTWLAMFTVLVAVRGVLALVRGRDPLN